MPLQDLTLRHLTAVPPLTFSPYGWLKYSSVFQSCRDLGSYILKMPERPSTRSPDKDMEEHHHVNLGQQYS